MSLEGVRGHANIVSVWKNHCDKFLDTVVIAMTVKCARLRLNQQITEVLL